MGHALRSWPYDAASCLAFASQLVTRKLEEQGADGRVHRLALLAQMGRVGVDLPVMRDGVSMARYESRSSPRPSPDRRSQVEPGGAARLGRLPVRHRYRPVARARSKRAVRFL
jgi:hypothetical protein